MLKNTLFMSMTMGIKLLSGIIVFVIMARVLGPHDFGLIMYSFTLASLLVLLVDYGFSQQLLRDVGNNQAIIFKLMGDVFLAKIFLTIVLFIVCLLFFMFFQTDELTQAVFLLLLASSIFSSFSEFLNVALRAKGLYRTETNIATLGAGIHFLLLASALYLTTNVILLACIFIFSRMIFLMISWVTYKKNIGRIDIDFNHKQIFNCLKKGGPYAADSGFTNFFYQIDTIIVNYYMGLSGVGLYQAATKWLQGAMQLAPVLANVYLPTLAGNISNLKVNISHIEKLNLQMILIGSIGWLFFTFFGATFSTLVYGSQYTQISGLWPYVGLLIMTRYIAASQGVVLAAYGKQKIRVYAQIFSLTFFLFVSPILVQEYGLKGMFISLTLTFITTFVVYMNRLIKYRLPTGFNKISITYLLCIIIISAATFTSKQ